MRRRLVIPVSVLFMLSLLGPPAARAAAPPNDNLAAAATITGLPFSDVVVNTEASVEPGESQLCNYNYGNRTLWYSITPTADGVLQADMTGSIPYDHYIAVYQSPTPDFSQLTRITCATFSDAVTFKVVAGTTYYFQVGDLWSGGGSLQLNVREVIPPVNDDFENATSVTFPFSASVDIANATLQAGEPTGCQYGYPYRKSVWYELTPTASGAVTFSASGLSDIEMSAYGDTGLGLAGLTPVECRYQTNLTFRVGAGLTYYILARSTVSTSGSLVLNGSFVPAPPNDDFANATAVNAVPFSDTTSNAATTTEPGEPVCPDMNYGTAWYSVTPTATGSLTASASGGYGYYPVVGVFTGSSLGSLTQVGCKTNYTAALVTWHAQAGTTYFIQVGSVYYPVSLTLDLFVTPPPVADLWWGPTNASTQTTVNFTDTSTDPGGVGFGPAHWLFGDGTMADGTNVSHQYAKDGDYTVTMTATTLDGRSAIATRVVSIRTHDVGIGKFTVPTSARAGQTRTITVGLTNARYPESVVVTVWKGAAPNNQIIDQVEGLALPVMKSGRTMPVSFTYTFTAQDASIGNVTFGAGVNIWVSGIPDANPADNSVIALATRVSR